MRGLRFDVDPKAIQQGQSLGLSVDQIVLGVMKSAPYTHNLYNRRFEAFVFEVKGRSMRRVAEYVPTARRTKKAKSEMPLKELVRSARDVIRDLLSMEGDEDVYDAVIENAEWVLEELNKEV